ncbi:MAG: TRAM domain-containing protein [Acidobacteriota bacterium]|nr:class I SAM-dependent RNA methyltransferase [Acidobacteriota bacterium]MDQ3420310.1 TRAM domain-containing protein [Acidobacteriota bacterium]
MAVAPGQEVEVVIEKPASGGRMIARHDGEVLLVAGAIPGERVAALVTRAEKRVAFADTVRVIEGSSDRRQPSGDPGCGGSLYSHIAYPRQVQLKSEIIRDAYTRIGRIPVEGEIDVVPSTERGYRMRARFHVRDGRPGFYREGTRERCDARQTAQLLDASIDAVEDAVAALQAQGIATIAVELSENMAADQRALHLDIRAARPSADAFDRAIAAAGLVGLTARTTESVFYSAGDPIVSDPLAALTAGRTTDGWLRRHPQSFFQGNRALLPALTTAVLDSVQPGATVDLYAGVGLFAVALAASGHTGITAVEGDPGSGKDLIRNAVPFYDQLRVARSSVELFLARPFTDPVANMVIDPPRTGLSKEAGDAIARSGAARIVYVSCDPPTMARDARRLIDGGYRLVSLRGFDLFPNTPHVETLGVFAR